MPKEMKCPECGKKMRSKRYASVSESQKENRMSFARRGWEYKYVCTNAHCSNSRKEFDFWDLEEQIFTEDMSKKANSFTYL